jgi:hypothetical protein
MGKRIAASQNKIVSSGKTHKEFKHISMAGNQNKETAGSNEAC